jgi:hypothetical protein
MAFLLLLCLASFLQYVVGYDNIVLDRLDIGVEGWKITQAANDQFGTVSDAGDFNGDGIGDIIIGQPSLSPNGRSAAGVVFVYFGRSNFSGYDDLASFVSGDDNGVKFIGAASADGLGFSVSGANDVNGDGFDDIIVGAHTTGNMGVTSAGTAYVFFGRASGFQDVDLASFSSGPTGFKITGGFSSDPPGLGYSVSEVGDMNGDGYADVAVGLYRHSPLGRPGVGGAYVLFGHDASAGFSEVVLNNLAPGPTTGFAVFGSGSKRMELGTSVGGGGDFNGDGLDDFIVGAPAAGYPNRLDYRVGQAWVIYGRSVGDGYQNIDTASFVSGTDGFIIVGADEARLGTKVSNGGDFNGDGIDDVFVAAPFTTSPQSSLTDSGVAYIIFGQTGSRELVDTYKFYDGSMSGSVGLAIMCSQQFTYFPDAIASIGDFNDDGFDDVLLSLPVKQFFYVVYGNNINQTVTDSTNYFDALDFVLGVDGILIDMPRAIAIAVANVPVSFAGDVNGDGWGDLLLPHPSAGGSNIATVMVAFGGEGKSRAPVPLPTARPTTRPPTASPTTPPPTISPTLSPSADPTIYPTPVPSMTPTLSPIVYPTMNPTPMPSMTPTAIPTAPTAKPTRVPTATPTEVNIVSLRVAQVSVSCDVPQLFSSPDDFRLNH